MTYGWCKSCSERGCRKFRELFNGSCANCIKNFIPSQFTPHINERSQSLNQQEQILLDWLKSQSILKTYWGKTAASKLGLPVKRVYAIAQTHKDKGLWDFSDIGLNETIIIQSLTQPKTVYQLAKELSYSVVRFFPNFCGSWLNKEKFQ